VSSIAIYLEGGGDSTGQKAKLRQGMGEFLSAPREQARARSVRWKIVACGGRNAAHDAFLHAVKTEHATFCVLLVDSEDQVTTAPIGHLRARDGWALAGIHEDQVHLMVRTMESWLVADPEALARYYGQGFRRNLLPTAPDLESVPKADVARALQQATTDTQKGPYHKIRHGSELLSRVDQARSQQRCAHCRRLFDRLGTVIHAP
jgi:Domain of unknown function (DUF4276)